MKLYEHYPPDPELTEYERKRYQAMIDNPDMYGMAFNYEQSCLLRLRLNLLNRSSKRIERATYALLISTIILLLWSVLSILMPR